MSFELSPEPAPEFYMVKEVWGVLWPLHYNIFGILFALVLIYVSINLFQLLTRSRQFPRYRIFVVINSVLVYFLLISSLSLLIDPYESGEHIKSIKYRGLLFVIINTKLPCITASLSLIELSILEAVKMQIYSKRLQSYRLIFGIISIHFTLTLLLGIIAVFSNKPMIVLTICQICYMVLGMLMSLSGIHIGFKVLYVFGKNREKLIGRTSSSPITLQKANNNKLPTQKKSVVNFVTISLENKQIRKIIIILLITVIIGFVYWLVIIYSIISRLCFKLHDPNEWQWFIVQTIYRTNEVLIVSCIAYLVRHCKERNIQRTTTLTYKKQSVSAC